MPGKTSEIPSDCSNLLPHAALYHYTGDALTMIALREAMTEIRQLKERVKALEAKNDLRAKGR